MPTVCEESGTSAVVFDSTFDPRSRLIPQDAIHEKCSCHVSSSGRQFGRTISLDPQLFNRCAECHKEKRKWSTACQYDKISEEEDACRLGTSAILESRVGGTKLVDETDGEVKLKLLNTASEQSENDANSELEKPKNSDPEMGPGPRPRKPWTRRKLTLKITVAIIVIAMAIAGVVLGVINSESEQDEPPPVTQRLQQPSTRPTSTESSSRNCSLMMELDKDSIHTDTPHNFQSYTLPWKSSLPKSNAIVYSPKAMTFNVIKSGYFTIHVDVHIDTNFWISSEDLKKTFSSILCIQLPKSKKCNTSKYIARTVRAQQLYKEVYLEKGETFHVTIEVNTLNMIYHLPSERNNIIEITSKRC